MVEWVLIMSLVMKDSVDIHTQEFSTQQACVIAGVQWKKHMQEELTKAKIEGSIVVVGCTPKNVTVLPEIDNENVI